MAAANATATFARRSFGERALLTSEPRAATVACVTDSDFLVIGRRDYLRVLRDVHERESTAKISFLKTVRYFDALPSTVCEEVAQKVRKTGLGLGVIGVRSEVKKTLKRPRGAMRRRLRQARGAMRRSAANIVPSQLVASLLFIAYTPANISATLRSLLTPLAANTAAANTARRSSSRKGTERTRSSSRRPPSTRTCS